MGSLAQAPGCAHGALHRLSLKDSLYASLLLMQGFGCVSSMWRNEFTVKSELVLSTYAAHFGGCMTQPPAMPPLVHFNPSRCCARFSVPRAIPRPLASA